MNPQMRHAANRSGHTLIELVTVLVLILVLATVATPSMRGYVAEAKTRKALDRVAADIAYARTLAVRNGATAVVTFSSATAYTIQLQSTPPSVVKTVSLDGDFRGVTLTAPTADGTLRFDSRGLLTSTGVGPLVVSSAMSADTAVITATGRIYRDY